MSKLAQIEALRARRVEEREGKLKKASAKPSEAKAAVLNTLVAAINSVNNTSAKRQAKWREAHPETNRLRAREGMKKRRQKVNGTSD